MTATLRTWSRQHPLFAFVLLTFVLAWSVWLTVGLLAPAVTTALILPGAWAPTIAALALTALGDGRAGVRHLLRGLRRWRVAPQWYLVASLGPTLVALIALGLHRLLGGTGPSLAAVAARFGLPPDQAHLLVVLLPLIFLLTIVASGAIAEELGWRGYAQPRLQARLGPARAGLVIGVIWSLWHLPLFVVLPSATGDIPLGWFLPLVTGWGVLFGWLYNRTGGSTLLCILFHAGMNFVTGALGLVTVSGEPALMALFVGLMGIAALVTFVWLEQGDQPRDTHLTLERSRPPAG